MDAVKFLEVRKRMCSELVCYECPLSYEEDGFMLCKAFSKHENFEEAVQIVEEWEKNNPVKTSQVAPVIHGRWIGVGDGYANGVLVYDVWHCSECDYCIDDGTDDQELLPKYCPNCGAKMDGDEGDG